MRAILAGICGLLLSASALGQALPSKPVRLILPYTAGGAIDVIARVAAEKLTAMWPQPVIVEARPGANGNIAADAVLKSPPDGHTWLIQGTALTANLALYGDRQPWDPRKDFAGVAALAWTHSVLVVPASLPVNTLAEFVAYAKAKPGLPYANPGTGSSLHLGAELFKQVAGIDLTPINYKGQSQALPDLLNGQVAFKVIAIALVTSHIKAGKLKALAVTNTMRNDLAPNVPTMQEAGFPMIHQTWAAFFAPAKTPADALAKLRTELVAAMKVPGIAEKIRDTGFVPAPLDAEQLGASHRSEVARLAKLVKEAGIKAE